MRRPILNSFGPGSMSAPSLSQGSTNIINDRRIAGTIVGVVGNSKGGSGKSTLLMNTAVGYAWRKKRVLCIDADPKQGTVRKWPRETGNPKVISCSSVEVVGRLAAVIASYDVVLIDLPGSDDRAIASVLEIADILISPTKPSHQDMSELYRFIDVAEAKGVPHFVVFNETTREMTREIARLQQEHDRFAPFLPIAIQQLSSYRRVYPFGRGVLEIRGDDDPAKANFSRVFECLRRIIEGAHAERNAK